MADTSADDEEMPYTMRVGDAFREREEHDADRVGKSPGREKHDSGGGKRALQRPDMATGGLIVIAFAEDAAELRSGAADLGLSEGAWDNGTVLPEMLA